MKLRDRVELLSQKVEARKLAGVRARLCRRLWHLFQLAAEGRPLPPPRPMTPERRVLLDQINKSLSDDRAWARLVARANGWTEEPVTITLAPQRPQLQAPADGTTR